MPHQNANNTKITVMSYWFSSNPVLRQEILSLFSNVTFQDEPIVRTTDELIDHLRHSRGMMLGADNITADVLRGLPELEIISVFGSGMDNLDVDFARSQNIKIGCSTGVNAVSVAEQTLALMIGLCRKLFFNHMALKNGEWREEDGGWDLRGRTVGIVGCGSTGSALLKVLQPFDCNVLLHDIADVSELADRYRARQVDFEHLLSHADLISLHVPLMASTHHLIGAEQLHLMKSSAYLINVSRGAVVNQDALRTALINGEIAGAALDVFDPEPPTDTSFLSLPNLVLTPHTAGGSDDAVLAMGRSAIAHLAQYFLDGGKND